MSESTMLLICPHFSFKSRGHLGSEVKCPETGGFRNTDAAVRKAAAEQF